MCYKTKRMGINIKFISLFVAQKASHIISAFFYKAVNLSCGTSVSFTYDA